MATQYQDGTTQDSLESPNSVTVAYVKKLLRAAMNGPLSQSLREKGLGYRLIFGVDWPRLTTIANEIGKSHQLAQDLWKEDVRECRLLAGLVQPTESFYPDIADIWVESMHYPEEAQYTVMSLFCHLPYASDRAFAWIADSRPMFQLCGFLTLSRLFMKGFPLMKKSEYEYLDQAETALQNTDLHIRKAAYDSLLKYAQTGEEQEALADRVLRTLEKNK